MTWVPLTKESAKATQERIEATIGLSRETFRASAFLAQGDGASVWEATPGARKKLLSDVLGLDRYETLRDRARSDLRNIERRLNEITGRVANAREVVALKPDVERQRGEAVVAELDAADTLADREREHLKIGQRWQQAREQAARRQAAEAELATAQAALEHLQRHDAASAEAVTAHAATTGELDQLPSADVVEGLVVAQAELARQQQAYRERQEAAAAAKRERDRAAEQRDEAAERLDKLTADEQRTRMQADALRIADSAVCQTCGQPVEDDAKERAIADLERKAEELAGQITKTAATVAECARVVEEGDQLLAVAAAENLQPPDEQELDNVNAALASARAAAAQRARLEERLVALQTTIDARPAQADLEEAAHLVVARAQAVDALQAVDVAAIEREGHAAKAELDRAKVAFDAARTARARLEERLAQIATAEEQIAAAEIEGAGIAAQVEEVAQLERALSPDGIPALIVENSAIPYLETEASRILADLGTSFRVELRTQAALKSGDGVRDTLDVVIQTQESERPYETFSGGERTRLNLALRIALARLLAHRRGAESRLLCIDEPEFLDEQGTAALVDVLRGLHDDFDRVYLISHVPALRDSFDEVLTVVKGDDGLSRVEEASVFEPVAA